MRIIQNKEMYPDYPNTMMWGTVNYAIQASWKQDLCEETGQVEAKSNCGLCGKSKEDDSSSSEG